LDTDITAVHVDDVAYELSLAKRFTDQLGFLTRDAVEHYAMRGGVLRARENEEPAGFLVFVSTKGDQPRVAQIYQAAVQLDAQRRKHGLALVDQACQLSRSSGAHLMQCWCASDLEANEFWLAAGFTNCGDRPGGRRRRRRHYLWQMALTSSYALQKPNPVSHAAPGSTQVTLFDHLDLPQLTLGERLAFGQSGGIHAAKRSR